MITSHQGLSETDWQKLGELTLPIESDNTSPVQTWLTELLAPLNLSMDFFVKILNSTQDAVFRARKPPPHRISEHLHLIVFISADRDVNKQNWGFFRVEKIEDVISQEGVPDHAIELYLYLDGK